MPQLDTVQQIKARLDIVELISDYVKLKQSGMNFKGLCPFHNEKTPSFMVNKDRQMWHCFGCNIGGDMFEFIQKVEGVEFIEALEILAKCAGVVIERRNPGENNQRLKLFEALEQAAIFYNEQLKNSTNLKAKQYLDNRQITSDSVVAFNIGYAPAEWDRLSNYLRSQNFSLSDVMAAGLVIKSERGPGVYDRFRDRLIFPISDIQNRVVGFGGRILDKDAKEAKYINSPQSPVYNKSAVLYNLERAKNYIKEQGYAVLVEGYMDVVGVWQVGIKNVVATSGTALTVDQVKLLKRYTNELRLAFDADLAGRSAAERGIDLALAADMEVKVITLPQGKDPDECAKKDSVGLHQAIAEALPIVDYAFKTVLAEVDVNTREGKKIMAVKLLNAIGKLTDPVEQDYYLKKLASTLSVDEQVIRQKFSSNVKPETQTVVTASTESSKVDRNRLLAEQLMSLVIKWPEYLVTCANQLPAEVFEDEDLRSLYKHLTVYYNETQSSGSDGFKFETINEPKAQQLFDVLYLKSDQDFANLNSDEVKLDFLNLIKELKTIYLSKEMKTLAAAIRQAEKLNNQAELEDLLAKFAHLSRDLAGLQN